MTSIILVGLNHKTASIDLREQVTFTLEQVRVVYEDLRALISETWSLESDRSLLGEMVLLSTCNRFEVYATTPLPEDGIAFLEQFIAQVHGVTSGRLASCSYRLTGDAAAEHIMRVASGLDSMILGESQILGQVSTAFEAARTAGMVGPVLSRLFAQAIHAGKRARSETAIGRFSTSVSHVGVQTLFSNLTNLPNPNVLIVGAGEMATLAAQSVRNAADSGLVFINRSFNRAAFLAETFDGRARHWLELEQALIQADAVICATAAPHTILYAVDIERVLSKREHRPLVILDIAVPRDVEPATGDIPGVTLFDIDTLQAAVEANLDLRRAEVPVVERLIAEELTTFREWILSRDVTPVIRTLHEWAQTVADDELQRTLNRLSDADEGTRQIVILMAHRLVSRMLHGPTAWLRQQASTGNGHAHANAILELFALETIDIAKNRNSGVPEMKAQSDVNVES